MKPVPWRWSLAPAGETVALERGTSLLSASWRRLAQNRIALAALWFLALVGVTSLLAPLWPLPSPAALRLAAEAAAPVAPWVEFGNHGFEREYWRLSALDERLVDLRVALFGDWQTGHWLGTDAKGRDLLARIVWGSRTSIAVALLAMATSLVIGVVWGAFAGFVGGTVDRVMMRIVDVLYSLPFIFVVIFLISVLQGWKDVLETRLGIDREVVFYLTIGAVYWLTMARVVRGQVLSLRRAEFVEAARQMGASTARILFVHVVPNVLGIVIVYLTLSIPAVMLFESFLTFLGLGIEAPKVSWGLLAVDGAETITPLGIDWWLLVWPSLAMGSTLLALNVLGDGLRDALDPKLSAGGKAVT
jgi:oligopeptide transport system permease protein